MMRARYTKAVGFETALEFVAEPDHVRMQGTISGSNALFMAGATTALRYAMSSFRSMEGQAPSTLRVPSRSGWQRLPALDCRRWIGRSSPGIGP